MIIVTTGSNPFNTIGILEKMDEIAPHFDEEVVMQIGKTEFEGKNTRCFTFVSEKEIQEIFDGADVFIILPHVGSMLNAVTRSKPMVMVFDIPDYRKKTDYGENARVIAEYVVERGWGVICKDLSNLEEDIRKAKSLKIEKYTPNTQLADYLSGRLEEFDRTRKTR